MPVCDRVVSPGPSAGTVSFFPGDHVEGSTCFFQESGGHGVSSIILYFFFLIGN